MITASADWPEAEKFDPQEGIVDPVRRYADAKEGTRAFAEKRPPRWTAS